VSGKRCAPSEWLEFTAELLATPLITLPGDSIAKQLLCTFEGRGCVFSSVRARVPIRTIWPSDFFGPDGSSKWAALSAAPALHPILAYYKATRSTFPVQLADVPKPLCDRWRSNGWEAFCRTRDVQEQVSIPIHRNMGFLVGRPTVYTDSEFRLAQSIQRLLIGLDRQVTCLERRRNLAGNVEAAPASAVRLTPREVSVLSLLTEGITAVAAAHRLGIAERTIHKHLERIYAKLGVSDRVSAVLRAHQLGIVPILFDDPQLQPFDPSSM
jgi:DNA-binding CsgD family transcriptional regulator